MKFALLPLFLLSSIQAHAQSVVDAKTIVVAGLDYQTVNAEVTFINWVGENKIDFSDDQISKLISGGCNANFSFESSKYDSNYHYSVLGQLQSDNCVVEKREVDLAGKKLQGIVAKVSKTYPIAIASRELSLNTVQFGTEKLGLSERRSVRETCVFEKCKELPGVRFKLFGLYQSTPVLGKSILNENDEDTFAIESIVNPNSNHIKSIVVVANAYFAVLPLAVYDMETNSLNCNFGIGTACDQNSMKISTDANGMIHLSIKISGMKKFAQLSGYSAKISSKGIFVIDDRLNTGTFMVSGQ